VKNIPVFHDPESALVEPDSTGERMALMNGAG
jgi:hypothetical protein